MALDHVKTLDIIEVMEAFLAQRRPPEEIRDKLNIGYKIEGQSVFIFGIRPRWDKPEEKREFPFAKTTYVSAKNHWKVFWIRANGNWDPYKPKLIVKTLNEFIKLVEEDAYGCFWG